MHPDDEDGTSDTFKYRAMLASLVFCIGFWIGVIWLIRRLVGA